MFASSIHRKLTILIVILFVPTIALLYFGERMISSQREQVRIGLSGLSLIGEVWNAGDTLNKNPAERLSNYTPDFQSFFQIANVGKEDQKGILTKWDKAQKQKSTAKSLYQIKLIISKIAETADLTSLLSDVDPAYAIVAFDRIPELSYRIEVFLRLTERLQKKAKIGSNDVMAFLVNAGQFKSVSDYVSRNSRMALTDPKFGKSKKTNEMGSIIRKQNGKFQKDAVTVTKDIIKQIAGTDLDISKMQAQEIAYDKKLSKYWLQIDGVFTKWLVHERDQLKMLYSSLICGFVIFMGALGFVVWFLRKSIIGQADSLEVALAAADEHNFSMKKREQELIQERRKAVAGEKSKAEFLANMSHEIRTPMNGVMGMAELMAATELNEKQKMFTDVILSSGSSLLTIINDILDFSKLDAGQMELDVASFNLRNLVEDVAMLLSSKVDEKGIELIVRVDPKLPEMFMGDAGRIKQIVTNIAGNAVKFTEHGHILIDVSPVGGLSETNQGLRCSIQDTGDGISDANLAKVFEKFSQVDGSATRKHDGTGLGLSICSSLVKLMKGEIGVESKEGEGSNFWFEIALDVDATPSTQQEKSDISGARVLVVDDNKINRTIFSEQLAAWNCDCAAVESGGQALSVLDAVYKQGMEVDCIILDYQMPEMKGDDVVAAIKQRPRFAHIPIILLTSVSETTDGKSFSSLGIEGHLTKPARSQMLLEMLSRTVRSEISSETREVA